MNHLNKKFLGARLRLHFLLLLVIGGVSLSYMHQEGSTHAYYSDPATTCAGVTQIPVSECVALLNFNNAMGGDDRQYHTPAWGNVSSICSRYGVTCVGNHVTKLLVNNNNLSGVLPSHYGDGGFYSLKISYILGTDLPPLSFHLTELLVHSQYY